MDQSCAHEPFERVLQVLCPGSLLDVREDELVVVPGNLRGNRIPYLSHADGVVFTGMFCKVISIVLQYLIMYRLNLGVIMGFHLGTDSLRLQ